MKLVPGLVTAAAGPHPGIDKHTCDQVVELLG